MDPNDVQLFPGRRAPRDPVGVFAPGTLAGRTAVVTGGGRNIGRAIALAFARLGAQVVVAGRGHDDLQATQALIEGNGGVCAAVATDIRDPAQVEGLLAAAIERFGGVDLLVNNAGGQYPSAPGAISDKGWRAVVDLNLNGTWNMCSRFMPHLVERGDGAIVNLVHSFVSERGAPMMAHSGAARAGVVNLTRSLAPELAKQGVTINALAFAFVDTGGLDEEIASAGSTRDELDGTIGGMGIRLGTPDEIAAIVAFLCSPAGRFIAGSVVVADLAATQMNWPFLDTLADPLP